jgi:hypothetical protein
MDNVQPGKIADRRVFFKGSRIWSCTRCGRNKSRGWQEPRNQDNSSRAIIVCCGRPAHVHTFGCRVAITIPQSNLPTTER